MLVNILYGNMFFSAITGIVAVVILICVYQIFYQERISPLHFMQLSDQASQSRYTSRAFVNVHFKHPNGWEESH